MVYLPTFTIKISQMWVNIPHMDDTGKWPIYNWFFYDSSGTWGNRVARARDELLATQHDGTKKTIGTKKGNDNMDVNPQK